MQYRSSPHLATHHGAMRAVATTYMCFGERDKQERAPPRGARPQLSSSIVDQTLPRLDLWWAFSLTKTVWDPTAALYSPSPFVIPDPRSPSIPPFSSETQPRPEPHAVRPLLPFRDPPTRGRHDCVSRNRDGRLALPSVHRTSHLLTSHLVRPPVLFQDPSTKPACVCALASTESQPSHLE